MLNEEDILKNQYYVPRIFPQQLYLRRMRIIGAAGTNRRDVQRAPQAAGAGKIRAIINRTMPFREPRPRTELWSKTVGKIILDATLA